MQEWIVDGTQKLAQFMAVSGGLHSVRVGPLPRESFDMVVKVEGAINHWCWTHYKMSKKYQARSAGSSVGQQAGDQAAVQPATLALPASCETSTTPAVAKTSIVETQPKMSPLGIPSLPKLPPNKLRAPKRLPLTRFHPDNAAAAQPSSMSAYWGPEHTPQPTMDSPAAPLGSRTNPVDITNENGDQPWRSLPVGAS